ncbi:MAG: hypothetical protein BGO98_11030 [Myxococcales bacterium 68-20]|nr:hypothetical protein [Myxococcales bacterium]OJY16725.1 MAG: hypothetical protein BGO98_11030 [Myxococcales bacterium 68-20]
MRTTIVLASAVASVAIASACASSEDEASELVAPPAPAEVPDSGDGDDGSVADVDVPDTRLPDCSPAGWCITDFPDEDLVFRDIAPFEDVAFAIAESRSEGIKVLEWSTSTNTWKYIDDGTQNATPIGTFAGRIYAPNVDEVYFTVGPSHVFHGKRSGGTWTWTKQALPDNIAGHTDSHGNPTRTNRQPTTTLGVWGTGAGDVYAYYSNTIFHRDPVDGGFAAVYVADDLEAANEHIFFSSVHGSGPNDVWFVGARARTLMTSCPLVVRKSGAGWERVADSVVSTSANTACAERPGTLLIGGPGTSGWLLDIAPVSTTEYVALHNRIQIGLWEDVYATAIRITDGGYSFEQSLVPMKIGTGNPGSATSLWRGDGETWFTSWGLVLRGSDDGTVSVSTLSRSGGAVVAPFYRIRGTSNQNLWAIGARHAYHKTTP